MVSYLFLGAGFEEIEALATVDILRRAGIEVVTVSVSDSIEVVGAHNVTVKADRLISDIEYDDNVEWLICPGGMPGATNLAACDRLSEMLRRHNARGGRIAAICASPAVVLSPVGILSGRKATCYPGFEESVASDVEITGEAVVADGNVITANGPANTFAFALAIAEATVGAGQSETVAQGMLLGC